jgi:hypothetical protein
MVICERFCCLRNIEMPEDDLLKHFARKHRLRVRLDECGDLIIPGRRGQSQLYFAGEELCLMVIDGPVVKPSRWESLGGKLWLGTVSSGANRYMRRFPEQANPKTGKALEYEIDKGMALYLLDGQDKPAHLAASSRDEPCASYTGQSEIWQEVVTEGRKRLQDVKITGIPLENARLAIRFAKVRSIRVISDAQREALRKARELLPKKSS